jgi:hypothetical protein
MLLKVGPLGWLSSNTTRFEASHCIDRFAPSLISLFDGFSRVSTTQPSDTPILACSARPPHALLYPSDIFPLFATTWAWAFAAVPRPRSHSPRRDQPRRQCRSSGEQPLWGSSGWRTRRERTRQSRMEPPVNGALGDDCGEGGDPGGRGWEAAGVELRAARGAWARSHVVGLSSGWQGEGNLSYAIGEHSTQSRTPHHLPPLLEAPVPMEYVQCRALTNAVVNLMHHRASRYRWDLFNISAPNINWSMLGSGYSNVMMPCLTAILSLVYETTEVIDRRSLDLIWYLT